MKKDTIIHGFKFTHEKNVPEMPATLHYARHIKSGAEFLFIEREDENMSFAISFKTLPEDDTGVFHILEHSVLCGSRKFTAKEPFLDLLKTSLQTFLNAMTYPDKTVYPVSSRCERDFLGLVDVYMDAVLHPAALEKPEIFYQEGWHYELHSANPDEEEMTYKGVVFNEMKGAYSSTDTLENEYISRLLYHGTPYAYSSGGDPKKIPTLTYENFVAAHKKFYHPSNAKILLDGSVNLDKTLALLDSYLSEYDAVDMSFDIPYVAPRGHMELEERYEITESESIENKSRISLGFLTLPFSKTDEQLALNIALKTICESNTSPLKKKMLEVGLCEDFIYCPNNGIQENSIFFTAQNVKDGKDKELLDLFYTTVDQILNTGIDRTQVEANINKLEFVIREQDNSDLPAGIFNILSTLDTWLYGGDPALGLVFEEPLKVLKENAERPGYLESLVRDVILNSKHSVTLYMRPSRGLAEERLNAERNEIAAARAAMSDEDILAVIDKTNRTEEWQRSEDTPEQKATLPTLTLDDVPQNPIELPIEVYNIQDKTIVYSPVNSRGISYYRYNFDVSDFTDEELFNLSVLSLLIKKLDTESMSAEEVQTVTKSVFGSFTFDIVPHSTDNGPKIYAKLYTSLLNDKKAESLPLMLELTLKNKFQDHDAISNILKQHLLSHKENLMGAGHVVAINRASAYINSIAAVSEKLSGLDFYFKFKKFESSYRSRATELEEVFAKLVKKTFDSSRLIFMYGGERDDSYAKSATQLFPSSGISVTAREHTPLGKLNEGVIIPAQVSYASIAGTAFTDVESNHGSHLVAKNILSLGYLWNEIRVMGGAYGAGIVRRSNGIMGFYSYRDPNANRSLEVYAASGKYLREVAASGEDLTGYIIGTIGDMDSLLTPRGLAGAAFTAYLEGAQSSYENRKTRRRQALETTPRDLIAVAGLFDEITSDPATCVVGSKDIIESADSKLKTILEI